MNENMIWLLESDEPWTRYRTFIDLLDREPVDPDVLQARGDMLSHPQVTELIKAAMNWETVSLKRHNDAAHPLYSLKTLAEFGLRYDDDEVRPAVDLLLKHQSDDGAFQTLLYIHPRYGGSGKNTWSWMNCDAPTLVYIIKAMDVPVDDAIQLAVDNILTGAQDNGWHCRVAPDFAGFRGPGRKGDPCPIANVYALHALIQFPELGNSEAVRSAVEMLLWHWEHQKDRKLYMFGIGTDFRKLKYPFIWYDILHVVDVLSQLRYAHEDSRFKDMVTEIIFQADADGRFTASSMYRAWKGWSFADKKKPSPWLTFLVLRILKRLQTI